MATNQKLPSVSKAPPSRNFPCGVSWISANSETGPMPGGGGGSPQGCTCSGVGGPARAASPDAGAGDEDCAQAAAPEINTPANASERTHVTGLNFGIMIIPSLQLRRVRLAR